MELINYAILYPFCLIGDDCNKSFYCLSSEAHSRAFALLQMLSDRGFQKKSSSRISMEQIGDAAGRMACSNSMNAIPLLENLPVHTLGSHSAWSIQILGFKAHKAAGSTMGSCCVSGLNVYRTADTSVAIYQLQTMPDQIQ